MEKANTFLSLKTKQIRFSTQNVKYLRNKWYFILWIYLKSNESHFKFHYNFVLRSLFSTWILFLSSELKIALGVVSFKNTENANSKWQQYFCGFVECLFMTVDIIRSERIQNPQQNNQKLSQGLMFTLIIC